METGAAPDVGSQPAFSSNKKLSAQLGELTALFSHDAVTLQDVVKQLGANASGWLVLLMALPFCAPVTIPGLSTPFGLAVAVITVRFALGMPPWLPQRLLRMKLPPHFFKAVTKGTERFVAWFEKRLHPRWEWLTKTDARRRLHCWSICLSALFLALPIGGIPFTNTLPGIAVFLTMIGIMERDGLAIVIGHLFLIGTCVYFGVFGAVFIEMMQHVIAWWRS
jgi:hypothetical protein